MYLVDINVWLALAFEAHGHHMRALGWFNRAEPGACAMSRLTQSGFLRLATNPAVFGEEAVTMSEAWILYDALLADERVYYLPEPHGLEPCWRKFTEGGTYSPKVWSDAYLAAFALVSGIALLSFDEGFQKFDGLKWTMPDGVS